MLSRISVILPQSNEEAVIIFSKGYRELELNNNKGKQKRKEPKRAAFLSTNTCLHSSTIIKKYIKRWPIEVCFKECKQMLELGKDQSNSFNSQVFATTASFLRYNILNYLNEFENHSTMGELFEHIVDELAVTTYAHRLWDFFYDIFHISFSKIFELFKIEDDFQSYINPLTEALTDFAPFQGCET